MDYLPLLLPVAVIGFFVVRRVLLVQHDRAMATVARYVTLCEIYREVIWDEDRSYEEKARAAFLLGPIEMRATDIAERIGVSLLDCVRFTQDNTGAEIMSEPEIYRALDRIYQN